MNKTIKITLIVIAILFGAAILVTGGVVLGRMFAFRSVNFNGGFNDSRQPFGMGPGVMGRGFFGQRNNNQKSFWQGSGMMGGGFFNNNYSGKPASIEEAKTAFNKYLTNLGNTDLQLQEVMVFSQNSYATVVEKSSGKSAMELLLDYSSGNVVPEIGPNHMWNIKYGMMSGGSNGASGCGMGGSINLNPATTTELTVTETDAKSAAQEYLDANVSGAIVADKGLAFYGYYTFDYSVGGKVAGMLSVNGYSAQVWPHTWHGQFVDEWELG